MATDKQITANRANAQKSTGPRTKGIDGAPGRSRRHSTLAESVLLESENPERFFVLASRFYAEYLPKGPTQRALVDTMITARWRLMRISNLEAACVDQEYRLLRNSENDDFTIPMRAQQAYGKSLRESRTLEALGRMEARLQRQFEGAVDRLKNLLASRNDAEMPPFNLVP
jgi:hypothetical protein